MINSAFRLTVFSGIAVVALLSGGDALIEGARAGGVTNVDPSAVSTPASAAGDTETSLASEPRSQAPPTSRPTASDPGPNPNNAREASRKGIVRSYGWMLKRIKKAVPGDIVNVQLLRHTGDVWTYDVTVLSEAGRYVKVSFNAGTGAVISKKNR